MVNEEVFLLCLWGRSAVSGRLLLCGVVNVSGQVIRDVAISNCGGADSARLGLLGIDEWKVVFAVDDLELS